MRPAIGMWVDDTPKLVLSDGYLDEVAKLGISTIAIMVDRGPVLGGFNPAWTIDEVIAATQDARELDLEVVLTSCPIPSPDDIDVMSEYMVDALSAGAAAWEVDLEGQWRSSRLQGFSSMQSAAEYLLDAMRYATTTLDVRLELTTHTGHRELSDRALVSPHMHRVIPQAYSLRERLGRLIEWNSKYGPGRMQKFAAARAKLIPGCPPLSFGLAAWSQEWPGIEPYKAMWAAYTEALNYEPIELRFWSSKFIVGKKRNDHAAPFIGGL